MYMIAPKKGTPTLSGFLINNCHSSACTTHNKAQHEVYTKKNIVNRPNYKVRTRTRYLDLVPSLLPQSLTDWEVSFTTRAHYPKCLWALCSLARTMKSKWVVRLWGARSPLDIEFLCYWWAVIALSDHPRWIFKKNSMEFFVRLLNYLYYFTSGYTLLTHNHISFWNVLWSHDPVPWYDYLSSHTIYILTLLYDLIL